MSISISLPVQRYGYVWVMVFLGVHAWLLPISSLFGTTNQCADFVKESSYFPNLFCVRWGKNTHWNTTFTEWTWAHTGIPSPTYPPGINFLPTLESTSPIQLPWRLPVKWRLQKAHFLAYKLTGWFRTAIFFKFRIFLIILVKYNKYNYGHPENGRWSWTINVMPIQETWYSEMLPEDVLSKIT